MSFADNFCKQFWPRSGPTKCWAWSGTKLFDTLLVFLTLLKTLILKYQQTAKKHKKLPRRQRVKNSTSIILTQSRLIFKAYWSPVHSPVVERWVNKSKTCPSDLSYIMRKCYVYVPSIKGRVFLGWTSTKLGLMFLLKDPTQWRRWGSNPQPLGLKSSTLGSLMRNVFDCLPTPLYTENFACFFVVCWVFSKSTFFFFQECLQSVKQFGSSSGPTFCKAWSGSKLFVKVISRWH